MDDIHFNKNGPLYNPGLRDQVWVVAGQYVVALLDSVGTKERLKRWDDQVTWRDANVTKAEWDALAIGEFSHLDQAIDELRASASLISNSPTRAQLDEVPESERQLVASLYSPDMHVRRLADSYVLATSLREMQFGVVNSIAMLRVFVATSLFMLTSLSGKRPVRGAIAAGAGFMYRAADSIDVEHFGHGLARAAELESKARFPRVLVDRDFVQRLRSHDWGGGGEIEGMLDRARTTLLGYLREGEDAQCELDYVKVVRAFYPTILEERLPDAMRFVDEMSADATFGDRYRAVKRYLDG